jgi:N-acyl-D-amino-acid deacylase
VLTLEEAVRKMTSQAADAMHLADRGRIAPGQAGDLVMFDATRVIDRATFADPLQTSAGIVHVVVGGVAVVENGQPTGARPGRAVRATTNA